MPTRHCLYPVRWPSAVMFRNWLSGIDRLRKVNVSVTERIADHWKLRRSVTLTRQSQLSSLKPLKMVLCCSCDGVPLKFKKKKSGPPVYQPTLFELLNFGYTYRANCKYYLFVTVQSNKCMVQFSVTWLIFNLQGRECIFFYDAT
jgi:hypothetical protein